MAESKWQGHDKRQSDTKTQDAVRQRNDSAPRGQALLLRALQGGVSSDYLPALMKRDGAHLPNSVMLDLLARQDDGKDGTFLSLPSNSPETEPMVWSPSKGYADGGVSAEPGTVNALPPPMALTESAAPA